jgi:hypothetical protein
VKQIGQFVGGFMMIIALASSLAIVTYMAKYGCPMKGSKMCPFGDKAPMSEMAR